MANLRRRIDRYAVYFVAPLFVCIFFSLLLYPQSRIGGSGVSHVPSANERLVLLWILGPVAAASLLLTVGRLRHDLRARSRRLLLQRAREPEVE